jgi:hypothetical protein
MRSRRPSDHGLPLGPVARRVFVASIALSACGCWLDLAKLSGGGASGGGGGSGVAVLECEPCPSGGCEAVSIAVGSTDALEARDVAVGSDGVYWVNQGGGQVMRFASGAAEPEELTKAMAPRGIAVGAGRVFFTDDAGVWSCPAEACDTGKTMLAQPAAQGTLGRVAFDGTWVYWTDRGELGTDGSVLGCDPADCEIPKVYASSVFSPDDITTSSGQVFWTERGDGNLNGNVAQTSQGGSLVTVSSALVLPTSVAVDSDAVYYPESKDGGTIFRCARDVYCETPAEIVPAKPGDRPFDVAVGGGRVYWSDMADGGSIRSCPALGCGGEAPEVHATGRTGISRLALATTCIFWVDTVNGGSVMKVGR